MTLIIGFSEKTWDEVLNHTPEWDPSKLGGSPSKKKPRKNNSSKGIKKQKR